MGVKAGGNYTTLDLANLTLDNSNDPLLIRTQLDSLCRTLDLDFTTTQVVCRVFIPHLVNYDFNRTQRHYFIIGGAIFELNDDLKLRPSTYLKLTEKCTDHDGLNGLVDHEGRDMVRGSIQGTDRIYHPYE